MKTLLSGPLVEQARHRVFEIAMEMREKIRLDDGREFYPGLGAGTSGISLFFRHAHQLFPREKFDRDAARFLKAAQRIQTRIPFIDFYQGGAGVGWVTAVLKEMGIGGDSSCSSEWRRLDARVLNAIENQEQVLSLDLTRGLGGLAIYALTRPPAARKKLIKSYLDELERRATARGEIITWYTRARGRDGDPFEHVNLGVAHGVFGILGVLSMIHSHGLESTRTARLARGLMAWVTELETRCRRNGFARSEPDQGLPSTRLAWCYGDPGAAVVMIGAARVFNQAPWRQMALRAAFRAASRTTRNSGVVDHGLCHGTSGLLLIFHQLFQATGEEIFRRRAEFWAEKLLSEKRSGGIAGYRSRIPRTARSVKAFRWADDPGFILGASGIGLALISALSGEKLQWSRALGILGDH